MTNDPLVRADEDEDFNDRAFVVKSRDITPPAHQNLTAHDRGLKARLQRLKDKQNRGLRA